MKPTPPPVTPPVNRPERRTTVRELYSEARRAVEQNDDRAAYVGFERASNQFHSPTGGATRELTAEVLYERGKFLISRAGRVDLAFIAFEQAWELHPEKLDYLTARRNLLLAIGHFAAAAQLLQKELELVSRSGVEARKEALLTLAHLYLERLENPAGAVQTLQQFIALDAKNLLAQEQLAAALLEEGKAENGALAGQLYAQLATGAGARKDTTGELVFLRKSLGADPSRVASAERLEQIYRAQKNSAELFHLSTDCEVLPNRWSKRAALEAEAGRFGDSLHSLAQALRHDSAVQFELIKPLYRVAPPATQAAFFALYLKYRATDNEQEAMEIAGILQEGKYAAARGTAILAALEHNWRSDAAFGELLELWREPRYRNELSEVLQKRLDACQGAADLPRMEKIAECFEQQLGNLTWAEKSWQKIAKLGPSERVTSHLTRLAQKRKLWTHSLEQLNQELEKAPGSSEKIQLYRRMAHIHRELQQTTEACAALDAAVALHPEEPILYRSLIELHEEKCNWPAAILAIDAHLKYSKSRVEQINLLRQRFRIEKEKIHSLQAAILTAKAILSLVPSDHDMLTFLAEAYTDLGEEFAADRLAVLEQLSSSTVDFDARLALWEEIALLHLDTGERASAVEYLEKIARSGRAKSALLARLASAYAESGKTAEALRIYDQLLQLDTPFFDPPKVVVWTRAALLAEQNLKQPERALRYWMDLLHEQPTHRQALLAVVRLAEFQKNKSEFLQKALVQLETTASPTERAALAFERAKLLQLSDPSLQSSLDVLENIVLTVEPTHTEALRLAVSLQIQKQNSIGARRMLERLHFMAESDAAKQAIEIEICQLKDTPLWLTTLDIERQLTATPDDETQLMRLADALEALELWHKLEPVLERLFRLARDRGEVSERVARALRLGRTLQIHLARPRDAFTVLAGVAIDIHENSLLAALHEIAGREKMWTELTEVYDKIPLSETKLARARILDERLNQPGKALDTLIGSKEFDFSVPAHLAYMETLSDKAKNPNAKVIAYQRALARTETPMLRQDIFARSAKLWEKSLGNPHRALDELLRALRENPNDTALRQECLRLVESTRRMGDGLLIAQIQYQQASSNDEKFRIATWAAEWAETRCQDTFRAFRAYLHALEIRIDPALLHEKLWVLAQKLDQTTTVEATQVTPRGEPTIELDLGAIIASDADSQPVKVARTGPKSIELSLSDVVIVDRKKPAIRPAVPQKWSPWSELTTALLAADHDKPDARIDRWLHVIDTWSRGANRSDEAFDAARDALGEQKRDRKLVERLVVLTQSNGDWSKLHGVYLQLVARASSTPQAKMILEECATLCLEQGQASIAQLCYEQILSLDPSDETAYQDFGALLMQTGDSAALIALWERRLQTLGARAEWLEILAPLYERDGHFYEAANTWQRLENLHPERQGVALALARVYAKLHYWAKAVEYYFRELKLLLHSPDRSQSETLVAIVELTRSIREICTVELSQPQKALDAFRMALATFPADAGFFYELCDLLESIGHYAELDELLTERLARAIPTDNRVALLERRAARLAHDPDKAYLYLQLLRQWAEIDGNNPAVMENLEKALERSGAWDELLSRLENHLHRIGTLTPQNAPEYAQLLLKKARVLGALSRWSDAEQLLVQANRDIRDNLALQDELFQVTKRTQNHSLGVNLLKWLVTAGGPAEKLATYWLEYASLVATDTAALREAVSQFVRLEPSRASEIAAMAALCRQAQLDDLQEMLIGVELQVLGESLEASGRRAELLCVQGALHLRREERSQAARAFREALSVKPAHLPALEGLIEISAHEERWDEAETLLLEASYAESDKDRSMTYFHRLAKLHQTLGRTEEAFQVLQEAIERHATSLPTRVLLGWNRYEANRLREAIYYWSDLNAHPHASEYVNELCDAFYSGYLAARKLKRKETAIRFLEDLLSRCPDHEDAVRLLAEHWLQENEIDRAIVLLEKRAESLPPGAEKSMLFEQMGDLVLSEQDNLEKACAFFERAVAASATATYLLLKKTVSVQEALPLRPARTAVLKALIDAEKDADLKRHWLRLLGDSAAALGHLEDARAALEKLALLEKLDLDSLARLSSLYSQTGDSEAAARILTKNLGFFQRVDAAELPKIKSLWTELARLREKIGDQEGAVRARRELEALGTKTNSKETLTP